MYRTPASRVSPVEEAISLFKSNPPDLLGIGDQNGEIEYVNQMAKSYFRTAADIKLIYGSETLENLEIVELGAFLGVISKSLQLMGASVTACDIPDFFRSHRVISYYDNLGLKTCSFNLRDYNFPFFNESVDCLIAAEIFEHLNFNPLPVFKEINRILRPSGIVYLTTPNGAYVLKRLKYLITGRSPGFTVSELFAQLDSSKNMIVGLHWKEYSKEQIVEMMEPLGFELLMSKEVSESVGRKFRLIRRLVKYLVPGGETLVMAFRKIENSKVSFRVSVDS